MRTAFPYFLAAVLGALPALAQATTKTAVYNCNGNKQVRITTNSKTPDTIDLFFANRHHTMTRTSARSGLNFANAADGLAWQLTNDEGLLRNTRTNAILATACRTYVHKKTEPKLEPRTESKL